MELLRTNSFHDSKRNVHREASKSGTFQNALEWYASKQNSIQGPKNRLFERWKIVGFAEYWTDCYFRNGAENSGRQKVILLVRRKDSLKSIGYCSYGEMVFNFVIDLIRGLQKTSCRQIDYKEADFFSLVSLYLPRQQNWKLETVTKLLIFLQRIRTYWFVQKRYNRKSKAFYIATFCGS